VNIFHILREAVDSQETFDERIKDFIKAFDPVQDVATFWPGRYNSITGIEVDRNERARRVENLSMSQIKNQVMDFSPQAWGNISRLMSHQQILRQVAFVRKPFTER